MGQKKPYKNSRRRAMSIVEYSVNLNLFLCHLLLTKRNKLLCSIRIHNVRPPISIISHKICLHTQIYELERVNRIQMTYKRHWWGFSKQKRTNRPRDFETIWFPYFPFLFSHSLCANKLNGICCRLLVVGQTNGSVYVSVCEDNNFHFECCFENTNERSAFVKRCNILNRLV